MSNDLKFYKLNESYGYVDCADPDILKDLYDSLSFYVPGYKFMPSYKNGWFDGKIHLFNLNHKTFPLGLAPYLYDLCDSRNYNPDIDMEVIDAFRENIDDLYIDEFIESKNFYSKGTIIEPREDQIEAVKRAIKMKRCLNICPTSFGKSISITIECLWYIAKGYRCLIVVPTKDLVDQFYNDIKDYATNENGKLEPWYPVCQKIYSGKDKNLKDDTNICISTWQSLSKIEDKTYMNQFDVVILDECHRGKGDVLQKIMLSATEVKHRTGWTGTLSDEVINELLVKGLFGPEKQIITTRELMDKSIVAQLSICIIKLKYPENLSKELIQMDYHGQTSYIEQSIYRTKKLLEIVGTQDKTGLLFYKHISHGEEIFKYARQMYPDRNVYLVHGGHFQMNDTKYKTFEELKTYIEEDTSGIVIANYQVASTGISIKHLYWMMFFMPIKSYISCLQSIGRVLRVSKVKNTAILFDIVDDFSVKKRTTITENFALKHFADRFAIYNDNQFDYKMKSINIIPPVKEIVENTKSIDDF